MKKKIALFRYLDQDYITTGTEDLEACSDTYLRISEFVEIDFPPLTSGREQVINVLEQRREKAEQEHARRLAEIDRQKSELLDAH